MREGRWAILSNELRALTRQGILGKRSPGPKLQEEEVVENKLGEVLVGPVGRLDIDGFFCFPKALLRLCQVSLLIEPATAGHELPQGNLFKLPSVQFESF